MFDAPQSSSPSLFVVLAYVDPQVGSYLFQLLVGGLIGGIFTLKTSWRSLRRYFHRPSSAS